MMHTYSKSNPFDELIQSIASYVAHHKIKSELAYSTATASLVDSLGCAFLSLRFKECTKLLGPVVPNTVVPNGSRVPGTEYILDPIRAAFNIGTMIRWLDFNDTWLAEEWGHPSDNLGSILAIGDYLSQKNHKLTMRDLLTAMIKAHEIQGILSLNTSFNRIGLDHVILVKIASAAVCTHLLGGTEQQISNAVSNAWIDAGPLRTYRHAPNTGTRKSWAAGDATSRGLTLAMLAIQGEMGYPSALTAKQWGFEDVFFKGKSIKLAQPLESYVMENILFKVTFPAEFHAQTAIEAAFEIYPFIKNHWDDIASIEILTHESAIRIIDKKGPLNNPADRDHCLQYMVAIGLLHGHLTADHYEDEFAKDPRIDMLREKIIVKEALTFSADYLDAKKRSIASSLTVTMKDGTVHGPITIEYPMGHRRRRNEGIPLLFAKFKANAKMLFPEVHIHQLLELFQNRETLESMPIYQFINHLTCNCNTG